MQKIIFIIQTKNKRPSVRPQLSQPAIRHLCHVLFQSKWKFRRHCTFHTATGLNANVQEEPLSAAAFLSPLSRKRKRKKKKKGGNTFTEKIPACSPASDKALALPRRESAGKLSERCGETWGDERQRVADPAGVHRSWPVIPAPCCWWMWILDRSSAEEHERGWERKGRGRGATGRGCTWPG